MILSSLYLFYLHLLEQILQTQLDVLKKRTNAKTYITNVEVTDEIQEIEANEELEPAVEYLETLADDIAFDIEEDNDDSIIPLAALNNGGILDTRELSNIQNIMTANTELKKKILIQKNKLKMNGWIYLL